MDRVALLVLDPPCANLRSRQKSHICDPNFTLSKPSKYLRFLLRLRMYCSRKSLRQTFKKIYVLCYIYAGKFPYWF